MDTNTIVVHCALAISLFFITNWIGRHSLHAGYIQMSVLVKADEAPAFNFLYRAFSPIAFITIVAAIFYSVNLDRYVLDIYMVVIYYFAFRIVFSVITGRTLLLNWLTQIAYVAVSIPVAFYIYEKLIIHKEFLFPSTKELGSAIWLAILAYIYQTFNKVSLSDIRTKKRKENYLDNRFLNYKKKYGSIISKATNDIEQEMLIYAILIYEAFNRPKVYRLIENILFHLGLAKTLGVMQVTTDKYINDAESVRLGANKLISDHVKAKMMIESEGNKVYRLLLRRKVIGLYNPDDDYVSEVDGIYLELLARYAPNAPRDWD
ncbi:MAG: hypothetical protein ACRBB4_13555 [Neptuniibacter sp.]